MSNNGHQPIQKRYDFTILFDVVNGNPNGDPDAGNAPRIDPETGYGLVSDVCLKRKVRNYALLEKAKADGTPQPGFDVYVKHHGVLERLHQQAYDALGLAAKAEDKGERVTNVQKTRAWMCQTFYDVRTFGAVMSTGINCGQVRGAVQISFSRSLDRIASLEQSITRKAVTTEKEAASQIEKHGQVTGTMGRKDIVPYGLYEGHGFVSAHLAADTGFDQADLDLLWRALLTMFEHDRSATRGEMATRKLVVFEHEGKLGNAPAHALFRRVKAALKDPAKPPRSFDDYEVTVDREGLPAGVKLLELL